MMGLVSFQRSFIGAQHTWSSLIYNDNFIIKLSNQKKNLYAASTFLFLSLQENQ